MTLSSSNGPPSSERSAGGSSSAPVLPVFQPASFFPSATLDSAQSPKAAIDYTSASKVLSKPTKSSRSKPQRRRQPPPREPQYPQASSSSGQAYDPVARIVSRPIRPMPKSDNRTKASNMPTLVAEPVAPVLAQVQQPPPQLPDRPRASSAGKFKEGNLNRKTTKQQQIDAGLRQQEVERRNQAEEHDRERRRDAIQKRVENGLAAIQLEKDKLRDEYLQSREDCARRALGKDKADPLDWDEDLPTSLDPEICLGRQVFDIWEQSRPSKQALKERQAAIGRVQAAIDARWPGLDLKVVPFGSSVNGLMSQRSDLDLTLLDPTREFGVGTPAELIKDPARHVRNIDGMPDWYTVRVVSTAMRSASVAHNHVFRDVFAISNATVPIVKFVDKATGLPGDLNINERFGVMNSQLIEAYGQVQPELFKPFVYFIKYWLSKRGLNDPSGSSGPMSFSSYTIALMGIQFLQGEGVIPNLQDPTMLKELGIPRNVIWSRPKAIMRRRGRGRSDEKPIRTEPAKGFDATFSPDAPKDFDRHKCLGPPSTAVGNKKEVLSKTIGKLVLGFLSYFDSFERRRYAISIVNGKPIKLEGELDSSDGDSHQTERTQDSSFSSEEESTTGKGEAVPQQATGQEAEQPAAGNTYSMDRFTQPADWSRHEIIVQDPFIIDRNTARNVGNKIVSRFEGELERARQILAHKGDKVRDLALVADVACPLTLVPAVGRSGPDAVEASEHVRLALLAGSCGISKEYIKSVTDEAEKHRIAAVEAEMGAEKRKSEAKARKKAAKRERRKAGRQKEQAAKGGVENGASAEKQQ